ncbi:MAG: MotA/TolQ/ExbB proton channel family protein [Methylophilaceae bacterium]|nr:MotA/TolQ/ExbB proton channel family protein [Methylophilaceae bacterium]MDG1445365.1 MotA/TolQ/ExbB proton channel family protein [Methylophilaceae bacterium]MDG1821519.1 MotA/TolQ/ExbB proton channel family protein [Methylophilaceae bacterium]MDG2292965.1 MotA/TolQ/ExbB proton channel family protein [Methylophilaceae bacterium]
MWEIILAAGWPIWPLIFASIIALAIIVERAWALRSEIVAPSNLLPEVQKWMGQGVVNQESLAKLEIHSLLGRIFASALANEKNTREVMKESIEETGRAVAHSLEKYLSTLGTIATVAPLLGLLGTVIGMVELFGAFTNSGHDVAQFARGISVALYNTAAGIVVAVPAMIAYRYFRSKVDTLLLDMEQQAIKLVEILHGER